MNTETQKLPARCAWKRGPVGGGYMGATIRNLECPLYACTDAGLPKTQYCFVHSVLTGCFEGHNATVDFSINGFLTMYARGYYFGTRRPDGGYIQPGWWPVRFN